VLVYKRRQESYRRQGDSERSQRPAGNQIHEEAGAEGPGQGSIPPLGKAPGKYQDEDKVHPGGAQSEPGQGGLLDKDRS